MSENEQMNENDGLKTLLHSPFNFQWQLTPYTMSYV